ncbi:MAG: polyprenyl synthetase family protein [Saprospiraceae bacterium]
MDNKRVIATEKLNREIHRIIYPMFKKQYNINNELVDEFFSLLNKRLEKGQCFRPYYMKVLYDYIKQCMINEKQDVSHLETPRMKQLLEIELPFFAEAIITIQYLDNHILDEKNGIKENNKALKKIMLSSNIMKDYLWEYINHIEFDNKEIECSIKKRLRIYIRKIFLYVDIGQSIELDWNRYSIIKNNIEPIENPFKGELEGFIDFKPMNEIIDFVFSEIKEEYHSCLNNYFKRIYLTTASLFILLGELLLDITGYKGKEYNNIKDFTKCYGLLSQIVNDNCDMVPAHFELKTNGKTVQDAFSDLKNKNITLPSLFHIDDRIENNTIIEVLGNNSLITSKVEDIIFEEIKKQKTVYKSISIGRLLAKKARIFINTDEILNILTIADWNKYYHAFYEKNNSPKSKNIFWQKYSDLKKEIDFEKQRAI